MKHSVLIYFPLAYQIIIERHLLQLLLSGRLLSHFTERDPTIAACLPFFPRNVPALALEETDTSRRRARLAQLLPLCTDLPSRTPAGPDLPEKPNDSLGCSYRAVTAQASSPSRLPANEGWYETPLREGQENLAAFPSALPKKKGGLEVENTSRLRFCLFFEAKKSLRTKRRRPENPTKYDVTYEERLRVQAGTPGNARAMDSPLGVCWQPLKILWLHVQPH